MAEYIERKALRDALYDADAITMEGVKLLNQFPAADVAPVRHGRWVLDDNESKKHTEKIYYCSVCENWEAWGNTEITNYCPNCGAKMDERKDK